MKNVEKNDVSIRFNLLYHLHCILSDHSFYQQINEDGMKRDCTVDDLIKIVEELSRIH